MKQGQKNWEYSHTEHAWPIVHAFLPKDKELNDTAILKQKLGIIQNVECNNHLRGGIVNVYNATDVSWMMAMYKIGYKYACVWYEGTWPANDIFNMKLLEEIDRYNREDKDWIVAGQIVANRPDTYPYLSRTFIIINLEKWMDNKIPGPYYVPADHPGWVNYYSSLNWEDSEYKLDRDSEWMFDRVVAERFVNQHSFGCTWIQFSLIRNLCVWGISNWLMNEVTLTKPDMGQTELEKGIAGKPYDDTVVSRQGNRLIEVTFEASSPIYFVNTEPSSPNVAPQLFDTVFDQYVGACAGFKLLYYAYKYGFNSNTKFVWFDFDASSVKFKQDTMQHWDGVDYVEWVESWVKQNPDCNKRLLPLTHERWPIVVDQFGGQQRWLEFWRKIQTCKHEVIQADLIYGHDKLFEQLDKKRTFFWASNIYSYIVPKLLAEPFALEKSFIDMIEQLKATHYDSWYSGTDVNDGDLMCPARVIFSATDNSSIGLE